MLTAPVGQASPRLGIKHVPGVQLGRVPLRGGAPAGRKTLTVRAAGQDNGSSGRQPWDFGRFVKTVVFFNDPPSPAEVLKNIATAPFRLLQGAMSGDMEQQKSAVLTVLAPGARAAAGGAASPSGAGAERGVVLVAGATGGVGKRVVRILLERGCTVRALVRDLPKAKEILVFPSELPGRLEVAAADITQRATLVPEMFEGVSQVVCCTAVKVAPKEGDTMDRAKYYQGIKFYDPEIVGDTPETVEYIGMQNLMGAVKDRLGSKQGGALFEPADAASKVAWGALDDVVMGGVSESELVITQGGGESGGPAGVFRGTVRTENSGGFTSVRTKNFEPALDMSPYEGLALRLKGNGLRYKLILRTDPNWDGIAYCKSFDTVDGEWQTIQLPFSEFFPVFRAKTLKDGEPLDPSKISSVQLMLSKFEYDGQLSPAFKAGPFQLPIQSIRAYMPEKLAPRFVLVGSAGVTRPNRPGINVDMEPPAVKLNDALGGILTFKLKGEDVVRDSGVPFAIVRPTALTEEPAGAELQVDQGDVIKGKISREDVAELCVELLSLPAGLDTTFEIKSTVPFSQPWEGVPGGAPKRDWHALLQGAGVRPGVTGKTVDGVYTGKEVEAEVVDRQKAGVA